MSFWREGESDVLRQKLAGLLRAIAEQLRPSRAADATPDELPHGQRQLQAWAVLADCETTLARVALEPAWQEGEQAQLTVRAQTVIAQAREILLAGDALRNVLAAQAAPSPRTLDAARSMQERAVDALRRYAEQLAASPPDARAPRHMEGAAQASESSIPADASIIAAADELSRQVAGLPDWRIDASVGTPAPQALQS